MNLASQYSQKFRLVLADTDELKSSVYRLRHAVYCEEFGFEPHSDDLMEIDRWDPSSIHILLQYKETGEFIGCGRLVIDTSKPFPIEHAGVESATNYRLNQACEASRVLILNNWRRRRGEDSSTLPETMKEDNRFPFISIALYFGLLHIGHAMGVESIMILAEKRLLRHVNMMGFKNKIFADPVEYKGTRYPACVDVMESVKALSGEMKDFYDITKKEVISENTALAA